jgi:hypothetical protein
MARAYSLNWELQIDGQIIHPLEIGEFGEGEEGRIKVADGSRKYSVRDQIFDIGEIPVTILMTRDRYEYDIMQAWSTSGVVKETVILRGRDGQRNAMITYILSDVELAMGQHNAFNRDSKEVDKKKYVMLPFLVEEMI